MAGIASQGSAGAPLALSIGCTFGLTAAWPTTAIMQVAPRLEAGVSILSERWESDADHHSYVDHYGNRCERLVLPSGAGPVAYQAEVVLSDPADLIDLSATETPVESLPDEVFSFVLPSRFCLPDEMGHQAWQLFGDLPPGWSRVQAICNWVHGKVAFNYQHARPTKTAMDVYTERVGVCRDFQHLAITFCRAMNIPARYATGYLGDIGVPVVMPMDFSAWFEVWLDDRWWTFDARNNMPRLGRVLMATGLDAADVALTTSFGRADLAYFFVKTVEQDPLTGEEL